MFSFFQKTIYCIALLVLPILSQAQFDVSREIYSAKFDVTGEWSKLKQLKNGNTILLDISSDLFVVSVFDSSRVCKNSTRIKFSTLENKPATMQIIEFQETGEDLAIYFVDKVKRSLTLYRVILDGGTGKLKSEAIVLEIPPVPVGANFARDYGNTGYPYFNLYTDPQTGFYAVMVFTPFAETNERIMVCHFNPEHKIINQSYFSAPELGYKYINPLELFVKGDKYVLLFTRAFNANSLPVKSSKVFVSQLSPGRPFFVNRQLPKTENVKSATISFQYDYERDNIKALFFLSKEEELRNYYSFYCVTIQPDSMQIISPPSQGVPIGRSMAKYLQMTGKPSPGYQGMPHLYTIDRQGNHVILMHTTKVTISQNSASTKLQDIVLSCFDENGNERYGDYIRCNYNIKDANYYMLYDNGLTEYKPEQSGTYFGLYPEKWNLTVNYVSSDRYSYLLRNERVDNFERTDDKKAKSTKMLSDLGLAYYKYSKEGRLEKNIIKSQNAYCNTASADFKKESNTYAVLQVEQTFDQAQERLITKGRVLWLKLD